MLARFKWTNYTTLSAKWNNIDGLLDSNDQITKMHPVNGSLFMIFLFKLSNYINVLEKWNKFYGMLDLNDWHK